MSEITVMIITRTDCGRYHVKPVPDIMKMNDVERRNLLDRLADWIATVRLQTGG